MSVYTCTQRADTTERAAEHVQEEHFIGAVKQENSFTRCNSILDCAALPIHCTRLSAHNVFHRHSLSAKQIDPSFGLYTV